MLFAILTVALPWLAADGSVAWRTFLPAAAIETVLSWREKVGTGETARVAAGDVAAILFPFLLLWELLTVRPEWLDKLLFPPPETIFALFVSELPDMLKGLGSSIVLLGGGYLLALATAIPLGLIVGWKRRLYHAVNPFAKVLGPIPPPHSTRRSFITNGFWTKKRFRNQEPARWQKNEDGRTSRPFSRRLPPGKAGALAGAGQNGALGTN